MRRGQVHMHLFGPLTKRRSITLPEFFDIWRRGSQMFFSFIVTVNIFLGGKSREFAFPKIGKRIGERIAKRARAALLRALHTPGSADEARIARVCPAFLCTAP
jgi:xanthine dehydrogenase iron-sulfur cluster and FAD-binding subunit A